MVQFHNQLTTRYTEGFLRTEFTDHFKPFQTCCVCCTRVCVCVCVCVFVQTIYHSFPSGSERTEDASQASISGRKAPTEEQRLTYVRVQKREKSPTRDEAVNQVGVSSEDEAPVATTPGQILQIVVVDSPTKRCVREVLLYYIGLSNVEYGGLLSPQGAVIQPPPTSRFSSG